MSSGSYREAETAVENLEISVRLEREKGGARDTLEYYLHGNGVVVQRPKRRSVRETTRRGVDRKRKQGKKSRTHRTLKRTICEIRVE